MSTYVHYNIDSITWQDDFNATYSFTSNIWQASHSFGCKYDNVKELLPNIGSPCTQTGFSFLKLTSYNISNNDGNTAVVVCYYGGEGEDGQGSSGDRDNDGDIESREGWDTTIRISNKKEDIVSHPYFKDIRSELLDANKSKQFSLVDNVIKGECRYLGKTDNIHDYIRAIEGGKYELIRVDNEKLQLLLQLLTFGITYFDAPTVSASQVKSGSTVGYSVWVKDIGMVKKPQNVSLPDLPDDHEWILAGINQDIYYDPTVPAINQDDEDKRYRTTVEYDSLYIPAVLRPLYGLGE